MLAALLALGTRVCFATYWGLHNTVGQRAEAAHDALPWTLWASLHGMMQVLVGPWLVMMLVCSAPLAVAALFARALAWRRVRADLGDPLEVLRRRPWATRLAAWVPGAA